MSKITVLGIDIAKNVFELCGLDGRGAVVLRKRVRRAQFFETVVQIDCDLICMEACASAHHWGRRLQHENRPVRLLAPHRVKAFGKGNKNDSNDAEAIALAGTQASVRAVAIKTVEQQDIQALHRIRELTKAQRTAIINQARGLLAEYGVVLPAGKTGFRRGIPDVLEDAENGLTDRLRDLVAGLWARYQALEAAMAQYDRDIDALSRQIDVCQRLCAVEGIGPQTATAYYATIGDAALFGSGREVSAWLGLVPKQHASGKHDVLGAISKRGNTYLRTLLIHGARAMVRHAETMKGRRGAWLRKRIQVNGANKAAVALANKNARVLWALMAHGDTFQIMPEAA